MCLRQTLISRPFFEDAQLSIAARGHKAVWERKLLRCVLIDLDRRERSEDSSRRPPMPVKTKSRARARFRFVIRMRIGSNRRWPRQAQRVSTANCRSSMRRLDSEPAAQTTAEKRHALPRQVTAKTARASGAPARSSAQEPYAWRSPAAFRDLGNDFQQASTSLACPSLPDAAA